MSYSVNAMVLYAAIIANMMMQITYQNRDRIVAYLQREHNINMGVMIVANKYYGEDEQHTHKTILPCIPQWLTSFTADLYYMYMHVQVTLTLKQSSDK